jgi:hypothetical protein
MQLLPEGIQATPGIASLGAKYAMEGCKLTPTSSGSAQDKGALPRRGKVDATPIHHPGSLLLYV